MGDPFSTADLAALTIHYGADNSYFELGHGTFGQTVQPNPRTGVDPCEVWCQQPVEKLREHCDVIKIHIFWPLLFTREGTYFLDENSLLYPGWILRGICEFKILEDLADLIKKVVNIPHFIRAILRIGSAIENGVFHVEEALDWVRCVGDSQVLQRLEELGELGWIKLRVMFSEWKRSITKVALGGCDLMEQLQALTCESSRKESELMKQRGNDEFSHGALGSAIISYTKAIELCPTNHLLYGNRALCFILTRQYERAVLDGKRATLLKPDWPKGHHHLCKALALGGQPELALEANKRAQELCQGTEGLRELLQQHLQLQKALQELKGGKQQKQKAKKVQLERRDCNSSKSPPPTSQEQKEPDKDRRRAQSTPEGAQNHQPKVTDAQRTESKISTLDLPQNQTHPNKPKANPRLGASEKMRDHLDLKGESKAKEEKNLRAEPQPPRAQVEFSALPEEVAALARGGCSALLEQQCQQAERAFAHLLGILYTAEFRCLNIRNINYALIIYGHASALLGMGQPEALARAEDQFKKIIEDYPEERCFCLAHYGIGKVYLRQNRFAHALDQFLKSKLMIDLKIVPGVLTWPATTQVIEETREESLQLALRSCIEQCRFPPAPDALCRYQLCHGRPKIQIFFSDPDFKGFIRVICCQRCRVEFHISCWKKLKTTRYSEKNDKDFLKELCLTPDCKGLISKIVIFGSSGLVKCEFEQKLPKAKEAPRARIKQKCSSVKKLKMKQEKKARRKRAREEARNCARNKTEQSQEGEEPSQHRQHRGPCQDLCAGDRVLQHLTQNSHLIQAALGDTAKFLKELLAWFVITEEDFTSFSQNPKCQEVMEQLLNSLIQAKSRVKTRGFLHVLSRMEVLDPKLHKWLQHLNNLGLSATQTFLLQHSQLLQEQDLALVPSLWNRSYGRNFGSVPITSASPQIWDYFLKPPLEKSRCFIWLLEDNREHFPSLHRALDEFFDKMDDPTIILKKEGKENRPNNDIKVKNKTRKKNLRESKSILVLSSGVSTAPREEEKIFIEENNLYRDFTNEPFVIPEYLQEQLEEFEALYEASNKENYNNPDPISESLYEYFSLILEEHGPLEINNKLLIGEYETFPKETRKVVEDQGGLESFLLQSPNFLLVENLVGLKQHSVLLEGNSQKNEIYGAGDVQGCHSLNPDAQEFHPLAQPIPPHISPLSLEPPQGYPCAFPAPCRARNEFPTWSVHSIQTHPSFPDVFLKASQAPAVFLPQPPWGYPYGRIFPVPSPMPGMPHGGSPDSGTRWDLQELATPETKRPQEGLMPRETQTSSRCQLENSDMMEKENLAAPESSDEDGKQVIEMGKGKAGMKSNPPGIRMVAVQVNQEVAERETNTLPFQPFENQEGDLLRVEKEHQVLQEQLREAEEKFQQLQSQRMEETGALEELLKKSLEETEVSQSELGWFNQDSETQVRKWQQEKKETREKLKALRSKVKKHTESNERYLKSIEDKAKQYNVCLNSFLDTSNKFANEKVKWEELIKKSQEESKECVKRAVQAEISVLQTWKDTEVWKLNGMIGRAETNLRVLKALGSSAPAAPVLKSQIDSWQTFLSNGKKQLEKIEAEYEEKMELVRSGARIALTKVENVDIPCPPSAWTIPARASISDPAVVTYSLASAPPAFSSSDGQGPTQPSLQTQPGAQAAPGTAEASPASGGGGKTHPKAPPEGSDPAQLPPSHPSGISGSDSRHAQEAPALHPRPSAPPNNKKLPKRLANIIAQLQSIFPNYSSSDFTGFIKEVQRRNGNSLAGLSLEELVERVTELILDLQSQACSEDPCTICHDELSRDSCELECGHHFHRECIRTWLKEHSSTCPICRVHALLPEDFPELPAWNKNP
ncbi:E3 ubiquitin-protein ligase TTC3 isoform X2 [Pithys albifrons albifrons]|uniref:E3 ubiquitin-protein ligase TTC3 isoform X2 n=1 Tax=Pithys albifrons albifrons TaxID=3385563 RepID=UPI003A5CBE82